jgi:hypothetical protein
MAFEEYYGLIELGFVYSVALGIGLWQVVKMRRMLARDREAKAAMTRQDDTAPPAEATGRADKSH